MYLDVADSTALPYSWSRYAQFILAVVNQIHSKFTTRKGQMLLDGRDVQKLQLSWLRRLIGLVRTSIVCHNQKTKNSYTTCHT
ncbi:Ubiquitin carboxyl-terminal hydrolase 13 [Artemisia annua]|uniref:Ubiquitin carboxyl-terminal hydrolase 13 n=1 Tax=Artemisia annua TaxID=35608 RepID=A0A2U1PXK5_ARTAN|nr:Ubiquitin carboxyl-terminal hydrolase 13 [Artemisia annua]